MFTKHHIRGGKKKRARKFMKYFLALILIFQMITNGSHAEFTPSYAEKHQESSSNTSTFSSLFSFFIGEDFDNNESWHNVSAKNKLRLEQEKKFYDLNAIESSSLVDWCIKKTWVETKKVIHDWNLKLGQNVHLIRVLQKPFANQKVGDFFRTNIFKSSTLSNLALEIPAVTLGGAALFYQLVSLPEFVEKTLPNTPNWYAFGDEIFDQCVFSLELINGINFGVRAFNGAFVPELADLAQTLSMTANSMHETGKLFEDPYSNTAMFCSFGIGTTTFIATQYALNWLGQNRSLVDHAVLFVAPTMVGLSIRQGAKIIRFLNNYFVNDCGADSRIETPCAPISTTS